MNRYDLVVIGGGSAGLVAAAGAALLGARVALVERRALGGDCLFTGCVPSKTLIRSARWAAEVERAADFGFAPLDWRFKDDSFASITKRINDVISVVGERDAASRFEAMGVEVIFGTPRFISPHEVEITSPVSTPEAEAAIADTGSSLNNRDNSTNTAKRILRARRFCIATGSRPRVPDIEGLRDAGYLTNEDVFRLETLPRSIAIIGAGPIAVELGQSFRRFGAEVTLVEASPRILSREDEEVATTVAASLTSEGVRLLTNAEVTRVEKTEHAKRVHYKRDGALESLEAEALIVAVGRVPNVENLNLEAAGVRCDDKRIITDKYLRTSANHIFAAGDVTGHFQFTHMAAYEASVVVQNALFFPPVRKRVDFRVVPWAIFTDPEVARVGMTEREAQERYGQNGVRVYRMAYAENDRANAEGTTGGFTKIICTGRRKKRIVGCHIVGAQAGELIHEVVLAMKHRLPVTSLGSMIHVYPTLTQVNQEAGLNALLAGFDSFKPLLTRFFAFRRRWF